MRSTGEVRIACYDYEIDSTTAEHPEARDRGAVPCRIHSGCVRADERHWPAPTPVRCWVHPDDLERTLVNHQQRGRTGIAVRRRAVEPGAFRMMYPN